MIYKGNEEGKAIACFPQGVLAFIGEKEVGAPITHARKINRIFAGDENGKAKQIYVGRGYLPEDPYIITDGKSFSRIYKEPNAYYRLEADIWTGGKTLSYFSGVLDGNGHRIYTTSSGAGCVIENNTGTIRNAYFGEMAMLIKNNRGRVERCVWNHCLRNTDFCKSGAYRPITNNYGKVKDCLFSLSKGSYFSEKVGYFNGISEYAYGTYVWENCVVYLYGMPGICNVYGNAKKGTAYNCFFAKKTDSDGSAQGSSGGATIKRIDLEQDVKEQVVLDFDSTWEVTADGYLKLQGLKAI